MMNDREKNEFVDRLAEGVDALLHGVSGEPEIAYQLWDQETRYLVAEFTDLRTAVAFIRDRVQGLGDDSSEEAIDRFALLSIAGSGRVATTLGEGRALWEAIIARGLKSLEEERVTVWDAEADARLRAALLPPEAVPLSDRPKIIDARGEQSEATAPTTEYSDAEAAALLDVALATVRKWVRSGYLNRAPSGRIGLAEIERVRAIEDRLAQQPDVGDLTDSEMDDLSS